MKYILRETIETINGPFTIGEIGVSVFWQVDGPGKRKEFWQSSDRLFHTLEAAQHYIRDTEHNANWAELFEEYAEANLTVK